MSARISTLQAGRALAALAVVACHASLAAQGFGGRGYPLLDYGWTGVDFFFVLSGFIIRHSIGDKAPSTYFWHRFRRVMVPYWPIGIAMALAYTFMPSMSHDFWSWLPTLTLAPVGTPALNVAWTLQYEVVFYLLFAIGWFGRQMWLLVVWGSLCVANIGGVFDTPVLDPLNLEFLFGIAAFHVASRPRLPRWGWLASVIPFAGWLLLGADRDFSVLLGLSMAIVLPWVVHAEKRGVVLGRAWQFLGAASYAIYLVHNPAISIAVRFLPHMWFLILVGVAAGVGYYLLVERPLSYLAGRWSPRRMAAGLGISPWLVPPQPGKSAQMTTATERDPKPSELL